MKRASQLSAALGLSLLASGLASPLCAKTMPAGVNLSGLEFNPGTLPGVPNTDYPVPSQSELQYYQSKGVNIIRLPILWERIEPNLLNGDTSFDQTYVGFITTLLSQAAALNMKVIIDLHNYGQYWGHHLDNGVLTQAEFATFWQQFAQTVSGLPGLYAYDLMNEPNGLPNAGVWPASAQEAVTAIRSVDQSTQIMVEGDNWSTACGWSNVNGSLSITDPVKPVIYQVHVYGDANCSGTDFSWDDAKAAGVTVKTIADRLSDFIQWCTGKSCMIGEIGVGNDSPRWNVELNKGLLAAEKAGLLSFTYWAGGPWWGSYPMSLEPVNGQDAVQMAVVSRYAEP